MNELRIIGGSFRSRKLSFPSEDGLRPTGNRIRETLFNWLAPDIVGATCLDLFAGSGALGMEALSRGAAHCTFIDDSRTACKCIQDNLDRLDPALLADHKAAVICTDSLRWLSARKTTPNQTSYDIVFMDPPFALGITEHICLALEDSGQMSPCCLVYLESPAVSEAPVLPSNWQIIKHRTTGQVSYQLIRRQV